MDLKEIHDLLDFYLDKAGQGYVIPAEKDAALHQAQLDRFSELKPAYGANQPLHDALRPFRAKQTLTNSTTPGGVIALNGDYLHLLSLELNRMDGGVVKYIPVELVNDDEATWRKGSALVPPEKYPFVTDAVDKKLALYPEQAAAGTLTYLRNPAKPHFVNTGTGRTVTYDQNASTQLEWNEVETRIIILKALAICGLPLADMAAVQFGEKEGSN